MSTGGPRIAVVGGGIAGLSAAYAVRTELPDADVVVLEAANRIGGKLALAEIGGVTVDVGAEAMLNRRPEAVGLAREVGLGELIVHPSAATASIWTRGALRPMPPTVMGVPSDLRALAASGVVSRRGVLRARTDLPLPVPSHDVSVAEFVRSRVGGEVLDRLVEPLLGGVYAGHASQLSLRAAAPQIAALAEQGGRLTRTAGRTRTASQAEQAPVFAGLAGGLGQLPDAVASASRARVRRNATVRELRRTEDAGWQLLVGPTNDEELVEADAVIVAAPGTPAGRLVASWAPGAARVLRDIEYASMAIVSLAVPRGAVGDLSGSGFLVPPVDGRAVKAATFSSNKWSWIADAAGDDVAVLRCSIGRAGDVALLQRDDNDLVALVVDDLREAIGLHGPLLDVQVQRWGGGLPQYAVGHLDRMRALNASIAAVPGLELCGAAYRGIGVPAVIESARGAAARTVDHVSGSRGRAGQ